MKKKISIKASIEKKTNLIKINQRVDSDILILEKKFVLPTKKIIKNKPTQDLNNKPFVLQKKFYILEKEKEYQNNVFNINKIKNKTLQVQKVFKSLGNKLILKNISLTIESGTIVGLLGPNGSGKTTLFNLIIGKIFPDNGKIVFDNREIHNIPIHLRSLGGISLLEQHKGLFGNMTAGDNLYAILELHIKDKEKINQKIESLLGYFDLGYLKDTKADLLSGGEYKKVSILQRICNPNITTLLLDEPCAALDPLSINSLKEFILELKGAGLSILITDHNYWAIENILDKAYIIKGGEILVEGTTEKISKDKNAIKYYLGGNFRF
jgi:lipopolysaccharide export system ATP-binding protein